MCNLYIIFLVAFQANLWVKLMWESSVNKFIQNFYCFYDDSKNLKQKKLRDVYSKLTSCYQLLNSTYMYRNWPNIATRTRKNAIRNKSDQIFAIFCCHLDSAGLLFHLQNESELTRQFRGVDEAIESSSHLFRTVEEYKWRVAGIDRGVYEVSFRQFFIDWWAGLSVNWGYF